MLAILALITFQLLYSYVANCPPHVASAQLRAISQHLFSAVFSVWHMVGFVLPTMKTPNSYGSAIVIYRQGVVLLHGPGDCEKGLCNKHAQMLWQMKNKSSSAFLSYEA